MNIIQIGNLKEVQLVTILDPFTSYSKLDNNPQSADFVNMYFDLVEIKKQGFQSITNNYQDIEIIQKLYRKTNLELVETFSQRPQAKPIKRACWSGINTYSTDLK